MTWDNATISPFGEACYNAVLSCHDVEEFLGKMVVARQTTIQEFLGRTYEAPLLTTQSGSVCVTDFEIMDSILLLRKLCLWPYIALNGNPLWTRQIVTNIMTARLRIKPAEISIWRDILSCGRVAEANTRLILYLTKSSNTINAYRMIRAMYPNGFFPTLLGRPIVLLYGPRENADFVESFELFF